jgi:hypothetical protein
MQKFDPQEGGLEGIETEIASDSLVIVFRFHPMDMEHAGFFGKGGVVRREQAGVSERAKVFTGEEAVAAKMADAAGWFFFIGGSESLGRVFDDE